jgi:hypothetical protein
MDTFYSKSLAPEENRPALHQQTAIDSESLRKSNIETYVSQIVVQVLWCIDSSSWTCYFP